MINININKNSNQSGRKEHMECSADTKLFFDDVYKSGTRGKKQQVDVLQYGRSMIEMLGVLAIVGVLSVGGISGYSKAMDMFKANKMKEQVNQIFYNAINMMDEFERSYQHTQTRVPIADIFEALNIIPDKMVKVSSNSLKDVYGNIFSISCGLATWNDRVTGEYHENYECPLWISLYNSASGQNKKIDVCTNIMEVAREYHSDITSVQNREYNDPNDATYYDATRLNLKTATPITINQFCTACAQDANCSIYVFFRS